MFPCWWDADRPAAVSVPVGRRGPGDCPSGHDVGRLHVIFILRYSPGSAELGSTVHLLNNLLLRGTSFCCVFPEAAEVLSGGKGNVMLLEYFSF